MVSKKRGEMTSSTASLSCPGCGVNLFLVRIESAELDVVQDGVVKQKGFLGDETDLFPQ